MRIDSSSEIAVRARGVSKTYQIAHNGSTATTLGEAVAHRLRRPLKQAERETFHALQDISFEIERGAVVGIIGRNGAGKSTLLKILSRITEPTTGRIEIFGRVGSLLEVGTGFHQELTGRENIYLNGAVLGMSRMEIDRKFDEIVEFSEVERFLDTPVKRYSSGMYVRLAFAVSAHLEPEVLIVDEVLAVGDMHFQAKCLGKMKDVGHSGRTVLFVSHNMAAVENLCTHATVLESGRIAVQVGATAQAIQAYLSQVNRLAQVPLEERSDRQGEGRLRISGFGCYDAVGSELGALASGQEVEFRIYYHCAADNDPRNVAAAFSITAQGGSFISLLNSAIVRQPFVTAPRQGYFSCKVPRLPLAPGMYSVNISLTQSDIMQDWIQEAAALSVDPGDYFGTGKLPPPSHNGVYIDQAWACQGGEHTSPSDLRQLVAGGAGN